MLIFPLLVILLLGWGLKDGEIYWPEAAIWFVVSATLIAGFILLPNLTTVFIVAIALTGIGLVMRVFGTDILIH